MIPSAVNILATLDERPAGLTAAQWHLILFFAVGATVAEVSVATGLTLGTVYTHKSDAMKRLGLRNDAELARHALRQGWVKL
jgi:DNA-binding NarL/FixJ family response regulator